MLLLPGLLLWLLLVSSSCSASGDLHIGDLQIGSCGFYQPKPGDTALIFYVEVLNVGYSPVSRVRVQMKQCCLHRHQWQTATRDCTTMSLLEDELGVLAAQNKRNLTLVYPTLYPLNRVGDCVVTLTSDGSDPLDHRIAFNTVSAGTGWFVCGSVDEDPQRSCEPVNCQLKYAGTLNYYNTRRKRCEKPVTCSSPTPDRQLPTRAFVRNQNGCKKLMKKLTADDLQNLTSSPEQTHHDDNLFHVHQYMCIHGHERSDGLGCVCEQGWTNAPQDHAAYSPYTHLYYLCNTWELGYLEALRPTNSLSLLIALCCGCSGLLLVLLCVCVFTPGKLADPRAQPPSKDEVDRLIQDSQSTGDSSMSCVQQPVYRVARVHTPNMALEEGELELRIGDLLTDLSSTSNPAMWKGSCEGVVGIFPVSCAEFFTQHH